MVVKYPPIFYFILCFNKNHKYTYQNGHQKAEQKAERNQIQHREYANGCIEKAWTIEEISRGLWKGNQEVSWVLKFLNISNLFNFLKSGTIKPFVAPLLLREQGTSISMDKLDINLDHKMVQVRARKI